MSYISPPLKDDCWYELQKLKYEQLVYSEWYKEEIIVKATIERGNDKFGPYHFFLTPSEYDNFKGMKGAFTGFSLGDDDIVINLLPTDIIYIQSDNYDEVKEKFDKNCKEKIEEYKEQQRIYQEKKKEEEIKKKEEEIKKKEEENKKIEEELERQIQEDIRREETLEKSKKLKEEEKNKPWYKKIIKFLKELFK